MLEFADKVNANRRLCQDKGSLIYDVNTGCANAKLILSEPYGRI